MNSTRQPIQEVCQRKTIRRWNSFSPANPSQNEGKLGYINLNIPTACPPRTAVPVNQGRGFASLFHLSTPGSLLVRNATAPTMSNVTSDTKASAASRLCFWMANMPCSCSLDAFVSRQNLTKVLRVNSVLLRKAQHGKPNLTNTLSASYSSFCASFHMPNNGLEACSTSLEQPRALQHIALASEKVGREGIGVGCCGKPAIVIKTA